MSFLSTHAFSPRTSARTKPKNLPNPNGAAGQLIYFLELKFSSACHLVSGQEWVGDGDDALPLRVYNDAAARLENYQGD